METKLAKETEKFRQKTAGLNPNEMVCGIFTIPVGDGENVKIPWFFIKHDAPGKRNNPCIWIQEGLHGDEYDGIVALRKLAEILPSMSLKGDILLIPVVNVPAYEAQANACPVLRILRYWGFLTEHREDGRILRNPDRPVDIEQSEHLYFPHEGILLDHVPVGTVVKRGETLINWASREGRDIYTMACPAEKAVILSIHTAAKADKGAYAVMLGLL